MQRIVIFGTTGSGKSWLAERLAARHGLRVVELDALFWGADWQPVPVELFRYRVECEIREGGWVVAGNYCSGARPVWEAADTLVWLDLPLPLVMARLLRRTARRIVTREDLWGTGNRETCGPFVLQPPVHPALRDQDPSNEPARFCPNANAWPGQDASCACTAPRG